MRFSLLSLDLSEEKRRILVIKEEEERNHETHGKARKGEEEDFKPRKGTEGRGREIFQDSRPIKIFL